MPALLVLALVLAVGSAFVELRLVRRAPILRKMFQRSWGAGFAFSILLSFLIGAMFGMGGLVVGIAALMSTMMTEPIHHVNRKRESDPRFAHYAEATKQTYAPVAKVGKVAVMTVTAPLWLPVALTAKRNARNAA